MKLKERSTLQAVANSVVLAQTIGFVGNLVESFVSGNCLSFKIGQQACFQREYGGVAIQKVCVESLIGVKPIVVTRNCVNRLFKSMKRQVKVSLIILHLPVGIDHVRRQHKKLNLLALACGDQLIAKRHL